MGYPERLRPIADGDVRTLEEKDRQYGGSWIKRGGVGAFMMLARKWDRLETALDPTKVEGDQREAPLAGTIGKPVPAFDIVTAGVLDEREEGILDDIGDLRRYLLLVEAEIRERLAKGVDVAKTSGVAWPATNEKRRWDPEPPEDEEEPRDLPDAHDVEACEHEWVQWDSSDTRSDCKHCRARWRRPRQIAPERGVPPGHVLDRECIVMVQAQPLGEETT